MSRKRRKYAPKTNRKDAHKPPSHKSAPKIHTASDPTPATPHNPSTSTPSASEDSPSNCPPQRPAAQWPLITLTALLAGLTGVGIKQHHSQPPPENRSTHNTATLATQPPEKSTTQTQHTHLAASLETALAKFQNGTLSAFTLRTLLSQHFKQTSLDDLQAYARSPHFASAPPTVRALSVQRLSEGPTSFIQNLFQTPNPPHLTENEIHILFGPHLSQDFANFTLWLNTLPATAQLAIAPELARLANSEPARVAVAIKSLTAEAAHAVIQRALTLLASNPAASLAFAAELPSPLSQQTALQGLQSALSQPRVRKDFHLTQHPAAIAIIHESIRSREDATPYRQLLAAEGVAESLPQGTARALGFEFLFKHVASIHLETALLRLSKLQHPADREYATLGTIQGCARTQPLRALDLAASLSSDSPRRHDALLLAAYAARALDASLTSRWLTSASLSPDERTLLTGESP